MRRVVKVGGSLLTWKQLPEQLEQWLAAQPISPTVMIAGGGPWAELLRQAAKRFTLAEPDAHQMCVQAMSVTASLLADLCACNVAKTWDDLQLMIASQERVVFDVQEWLANKTTRHLPHSWDVTSDSIAARLATELQATELVLLKSRPAPATELSKLAEVDYVDHYFPIAAEPIPSIRYVSLRS